VTIPLAARAKPRKIEIAHDNTQRTIETQTS
jgi:HSP20 family protein